MKVVFYCSKFPPQAGGAGIDAYQLGKDLSEEGHQVYVVCEHAPGLEKYTQLNHNFFVYRVKVPFITNRGSGLYFIALCFGIALKGIRLIFQKKPALLHCHDTATGIAGLISKFVTRKPTVFKFGGSMTYEYLCNANQNGWDPALGENWAWENSKGIAAVLLAIEKQYFMRFDRIYPIAQYLVDILKRHLQPADHKIRLIHNGVDVEKLKREYFNDIKSGLKIDRLIFAGVRFVKYKGIHILIEACLPILEKYKAHLVLAGSGPEEKKLRQLAGNNPRIIFAGNLPWEKNMRYVRSADIYVLPTFVDKTPSSLMEALALGTPCITSDIDGVRELITPGGGILVEPKNPVALREKIEWALENASQLKQMGETGRAFMIAEFQWKKTRESIKELYGDLL